MLLTPATHHPSRLMRNLKFLSGSNRWVVTVNWGAAMRFSLRFDLDGHLLEVQDDKLRRFGGREANPDIHDVEIDIVLRRRRGEVCTVEARLS